MLNSAAIVAIADELCQTGEAIVFVPSGICLVQAKASVNGLDRMIGTFARRYLHLRMRQRITQDGGRSVMVVNST